RKCSAVAKMKLIELVPAADNLGAPITNRREHVMQLVQIFVPQQMKIARRTCSCNVFDWFIHGEFVAAGPLSNPASHRLRRLFYRKSRSPLRGCSNNLKRDDTVVKHSFRLCPL